MRKRSRACAVRPSSSRARSSSSITSRSLTRTYSPSIRATSSSGCALDRSAAARPITSAIRRSPFSRSTAGGSATVGEIPSTSWLTARCSTLSLPERRQHVRDVLHERRVGPHDEDPAQALSLREEEVGRAMQPHGGLAGARPALHHERRLGLSRDEPVLVRLDRRDDVPHVRLAAALELVEQEVAARDRPRPVQRLVAQVEQATAVGAEPAAQRDVVGLGGGGDVERPGGGRLPVDDEHLALVVVYPAPADVERPRRRLQVEASEAEASLGVLERPEPSHRPGLERERGDLAVGRVGRAVRRARACGRGSRRRGRRTPARPGGRGGSRHKDGRDHAASQGRQALGWSAVKILTVVGNRPQQWGNPWFPHEPPPS